MNFKYLNKTPYAVSFNTFIHCAKNISGDILVFGKIQKEHDRALEQTFQAIRKAGPTLIKKNCQFNQKKISFFGVVFSSERTSPDPEKVKAIKEAKTQNSKGTL